MSGTTVWRGKAAGSSMATGRPTVRPNPAVVLPGVGVRGCGTSSVPRISAVVAGRCRWRSGPPRKPFIPTVIEKQSSRRTNCNSSSKSCGRCGSTPVVAGGSFKIYVDAVAGAVLAGRTCVATAPNVTCKAALPTLALGQHTITLTWLDAAKKESVKSNLITVLVSATLVPASLTLK